MAVLLLRCFFSQNTGEEGAGVDDRIFPEGEDHAVHLRDDAVQNLTGCRRDDVADRLTARDLLPVLNRGDEDAGFTRVDKADAAVG